MTRKFNSVGRYRAISAPFNTHQHALTLSPQGEEVSKHLHQLSEKAGKNFRLPSSVFGGEKGGPLFLCLATTSFVCLSEVRYRSLGFLSTDVSLLHQKVAPLEKLQEWSGFWHAHRGGTKLSTYIQDFSCNEKVSPSFFYYTIVQIILGSRYWPYRMREMNQFSFLPSPLHGQEANQVHAKKLLDLCSENNQASCTQKILQSHLKRGSLN